MAVTDPGTVTAAPPRLPLPPNRPPASYRDDLLARCHALIARWNIDASAVWIGRALLVATGLIVTSSVAALSPSHADWLVIGWISAGMLGVLLLSFVVPWRAVPTSVSFLFPVAVVTAIGALGGLTTPAIGSCYLALFVLCFAYVGIFHPLHFGYALAVVAAPAYLVAQGRWDAYIAIRLAIALIIWILLSEVLALLMRRQHLITGLLEQVALTDGLTGVGTRRDLDTHIDAIGFGDTFVICDLDHFKTVNDTLGHAAGDVILRDFGATLRGCLRGDDYAGRYGGEEFVLILVGTDEGETEQVLDRLRIKWMATGHAITFSAGYATHRSHTAPSGVLGAADAAMYAAKSAGRNRSVRAVTQPVH